MTADQGRDYAYQQIAAAETGRAHNQCPTCRRYRTDGRRLASADHAGTCAYAALTPPPHDRTRTP